MGSGVEGWDAGRQQLDRLKLHEIGASGLPSASSLSCSWLVSPLTAARFAAGAAQAGAVEGVSASAAPRVLQLELHLFSCSVVFSSWWASLGGEENLEISSCFEENLGPCACCCALVALVHVFVIAQRIRQRWRGWKLAHRRFDLLYMTLLGYFSAGSAAGAGCVWAGAATGAALPPDVKPQLRCVLRGSNSRCDLFGLP